jgi:hypothetical protein
MEVPSKRRCLGGQRQSEATSRTVKPDLAMDMILQGLLAVKAWQAVFVCPVSEKARD